MDLDMGLDIEICIWTWLLCDKRALSDHPSSRNVTNIKRGTLKGICMLVYEQAMVCQGNSPFSCKKSEERKWYHRAQCPPEKTQEATKRKKRCMNNSKSRSTCRAPTAKTLSNQTLGSLKPPVPGTSTLEMRLPRRSVLSSAMGLTT